MEMINYREEFANAINAKVYFIDAVGAMSFRITNKYCNSPQEQKEILGKCTNRILFDQNLKEDDLHHFVNLVDEFLGEFSICEIIGNEYLLQSNIEVEIEDFDGKSMTGISTPISLSELKDEDLKILENYSKDKFEACETIKLKIRNRLNVNSKSMIPKITLDLSVGDIALLFRLLLKDKILISSNQEEMYRTIVLTFSSKKAADISVSSFKNKFLSPDPTSVEKMEIVLTRLKQILRELKDKK